MKVDKNMINNERLVKKKVCQYNKGYILEKGIQSLNQYIYIYIYIQP